MTLTTSTARRALLGAAIALSLPLAACGGSDSTGSDDGFNPATAAPTKAPIFVQATVRPDGELKDNTLSVAGKLLNSKDPEAEIQKLLSDASEEGGTSDFQYERDLKPWLGKNAGVFFTSLAEKDAQGALILEVTDKDKAKATLDREAREPDKAGDPAPKITESEYNGTQIVADADDTAYAITDDAALVGTVGGVKAAIDALKSESASLAGNAEYKKSIDALGDEDDQLGSLYIDVKGTIDQVVASGELKGEQATVLKQITGASGISGAVAVGLSVPENAVRVDVAGPVSKQQQNLGNPAESVPGLPGDAWFALGLGDLGKTVESQLASLSTLTALSGEGAPDVNTIIEQLNRQLKIDIRKDLISWMGPAAIFARGTNLTDIGGAVVVQSTDPAATKKAIPVIERLLTLFGGDAGVKTSPLSASGVDAGFRVTSPQLPLPVNVALAGDKFIVALTDPALQAAIKPSGTLGDNAGYKDAAEALGDGLKPALYVGFPPILSLLDGFGLTSDPEFKQFEPTAKALQALAAGGQTDDEVTRGRVVLTLND